MTAVWYLAHPVAPPCACREPWEQHPDGALCNLARAKRWLAWCFAMAPDIAIVAPWMPYVELLHDSNPAHRERGLRDSAAAAARCDGIILCGGRVSSGMAREREAVEAWAAPWCDVGEVVLDLTPLGPEPPGDRVENLEHRALVARLVAPR